MRVLRLVLPVELLLIVWESGANFENNLEGRNEN